MVQSGQSHDCFLKFARVFSGYFQLWYAVNYRIDEISRGQQSVELMQSKCRDDLINYGSIYLNVVKKEEKFKDLLKKYDVAPEDYSQIFDYMMMIEKSEMMELIRMSGESEGVIDNISRVETKANLEILRKVFPDDKIDDVSDIDTNKLSADKRINIYLYYSGCGQGIQIENDFYNKPTGEKFQKVFHDFLLETHQEIVKLASESISSVSEENESNCYLD